MRWLFSISFLLLTPQLHSQDLLLTQFDRVNGLVNPALVGSGQEDYLIHSHYRNQWPGIGSGYTSFVLSGEARFLHDPVSSSYLGTGLILIQDQAGTSELTTRGVRGSVAYNLMPNDYNQLAFGLQGAWIQRTINFDQLAWDSQYNGVGYDPGLDSQESFAGNQQSAVDLAAGISWAHARKRRYRISYGVFHMMQNRTLLSSGNDQYAFRHTLRYDLEKNYAKVSMDYRLMLSREAGAMAINAGAIASYRLGADSRYTTFRTSSVMRAGLYYRHGDAVTPVVGGRFKGLAEVLLGYDITLSRLNRVNRYRGGWEVSLRYIASSEKRRRLK